jgi:hypothetical protein
VETIIITLRKEDGQELDLEVPREVCAADLVEELALAFGLSGDFQVFAEPPNRMLAPHETLAQAGIWDGARLLLTRGYRPPSPPPSPPPPAVPAGGPVKGWKPLDLGSSLPSSSPSSSETPASSGGFVWKRVDED